MVRTNSKKKHGALVFILKALIPYSRENMALSFSPSRFFDELEQVSGYSRKALAETARRARKQGLIESTGSYWHLTELGERTVGPFVAERLTSGAKLMIIFDVPEQKSRSRQKLRQLLRKWSFEQIQKSVWVTSYDHRQSVREAIQELDIEDCVKLYECLPAN